MIYKKVDIVLVHIVLFFPFALLVIHLEQKEFNLTTGLCYEEQSTGLSPSLVTIDHLPPAMSMIFLCHTFFIF